jgi:hypothetical protein
MRTMLKEEGAGAFFKSLRTTVRVVHSCGAVIIEACQGCKPAQLQDMPVHARICARQA